jgi:membrane protease YdiL (CAAX protease family)
MQSEHSNQPYSPWLRLLTLLGFLFIGALVGQLLVILWLGSPTKMMQSLNITSPSYKQNLFIIQTILASSIFIIAPWLYWLLIEKKPIKVFFQGKQPSVYGPVYTLGLVGSFIIVNTLFIQWNMSLKLPDFLKSFEQWAQAKEAELKLLTGLLTTFHSTTELLMGIFVMAIIPAIGEELLFRGILQNLFYQITRNIHWAIGISAFIFSAIHLQFYGFIPRFLLGVLFGYIYAWTRDLSLAMIAHFFNNAFTLTLLFLQQKAWISYDLEDTHPPSLKIILFFSLISIIFARALRNLRKSSQY